MTLSRAPSVECAGMVCYRDPGDEHRVRVSVLATGRDTLYPRRHDDRRRL